MKTEAASFSSNLCAPSDACRAAWASMRASASACRRPRRCRPSLPRAPFPPCGGPAQTGTSAASRRRGTATGGALGVYAGLSGMLYHGMKIVCKRGMRAVQIPVSNPETKIQRRPKVSDENAMPRHDLLTHVMLVWMWRRRDSNPPSLVEQPQDVGEAHGETVVSERTQAADPVLLV